MNVSFFRKAMLVMVAAALALLSFFELRSIKNEDILGRTGTVAKVRVEVNDSTEHGLLRKVATQVNGNTGHVFTGEKIREFGGTRKLTPDSLKQRHRSPLPATVPSCTQWAVVTTINAPTEGVKSVASLPHWCLVIVGDTKTPPDYLETANLSGPDFENRVHFLSIEEQRKSKNDFVDLMPERSFARKNIGYLFAIRHGAKVIYDFDDDNVLRKDANGYMPPLGYRADKPKLGQSMKLQHLPEYTPSSLTPAFNPLPIMKPSVSDVWPRGFPLELVRDKSSTGADGTRVSADLPLASVAVVQAVCNQDPDFDAVYRLTRDLPVTFDDPHASNNNLMVPMNSFVSYNAQATTHMYKAFWALVLPYTVPGRVTDIWRAYFSQRIFHDLGLAVVYTSPLVVHERSAHNYVADMQAEEDLYMKTSTLLNFLKDWKDESRTLQERVENLAIALYEHDYIGLDDVLAMQEWLLALHDMDYDFPDLSPTATPLTPAVLPEFHGQPVTVGWRYNVGGTNGVSYRTFMKQNGPDFEKFVQEGKALNLKRPSEVVSKVVTMSKDESLMKDFLYYHGHMFGFENLYILDGSTDPKSVDFLRFAKDHLGVNIVFTTEDLNHLQVSLSAIAKAVSTAADLVFKLDIDEFAVMHKDNDVCDVTVEEYGYPANCTLSPFPLADFLSDYENLQKWPPKARWMMQYADYSWLTREICESEERDTSKFTMIHGGSSVTKAIMDARAVDEIDLGGHINKYLEPHASYQEVRVNIGNLHLHSRCVEEERLNNRKAVISHGFINPEDDNTTAISKMLGLIGSKTNDPCDPQGTKSLVSIHKLTAYLLFLGNCPQVQPENFYMPPDITDKFWNPEFAAFLEEARKLYG